MVAIALDGELVASELKATLTQRISELEKSAVTPGSVSYTHLTLPTKA